VIGVRADLDDLPLVEEFFELFKTPWESYQAGRSYDVVLVATDDVPDAEAGLLVVYSTKRTSVDDRLGAVRQSVQPGSSVDWEGVRVPIYGKLLTFDAAQAGTPCVTSGAGLAGFCVRAGGRTVLRLGYDLFAEVRALFTAGQPIEQAPVPTLDIHISMLRTWILDAGLPLLEIAPTAAGRDFLVCLTHDIDFVGIRRHRFDHTMWGFLYRSTVGAVRNVLRRRLSFAQLLKIWRAAASLPLVYLGWMRDFWEPFDWYLEVEHGLPATYYLIPFKHRPGESVPGSGGARRATAYDITDIEQSAAALMNAGCEVGVHGIDAWHSVEKGRDELKRVAAVTRRSDVGIRMHWLLQGPDTPARLEQAGYAYDSTGGYNETIGYRNGTAQVFRPLGATSLLELPLHVQDGALFYPQRLDLSEADARERCAAFIQRSQTHGGVLTILWHDRSHAAERFWGGFYIDLVEALKATNAWFCTGAQAVAWFRQRRGVEFEVVEGAQGTSIRLRHDGPPVDPPLKIVLHRPDQKHATQMSWNGETVLEIESSAGNRTLSVH
jgi:hypothetical protein